MDVTVLAVGKLRSFYRDACDEYARRLVHYVTLDEREIREGRGNNAGEIERDEGQRMIEKLPRDATVVALTRDGKGWSSRDLAARIDDWKDRSRPVAFAIGGSTGLGREFLTHADFRWSLGPLTLPHELARLVVYEQIYRAFTILRGEPYHKGRGER